MPPAVKLAAAQRAQSAPDPGIIAAEIVEDLQAALAQFAEIANDLKKQSSHMPLYEVTQNEFRRIQA